MSNSTKKHAIVKDKKPKRWFKKVRVNNKQRVKKFKEPLLKEEVVNSYDVCDWTWILNKYDDFDSKFLKKAIRK